jgi:hypothetical protein
MLYKEAHDQVRYTGGMLIGIGLYRSSFLSFVWANSNNGGSYKRATIGWYDLGVWRSCWYIDWPGGRPKIRVSYWATGLGSLSCILVSSWWCFSSGTTIV